MEFATNRIHVSPPRGVQLEGSDYHKLHRLNWGVNSVKEQT